MQRLEVSGAVRPLYGSLGVKGLMKDEFSLHIFEKYLITKFHKNPSTGSRVVTCGQTDKNTDGQT